MLIEAATARSEHDPDLEASVAAINLEAAAAAANLEAAAAAHLEAAAADITMHPVTGAFADSSHESAFRALAYPSHSVYSVYDISCINEYAGLLNYKGKPAS